jgi:hypothetical protein
MFLTGLINEYASIRAEHVAKPWWFHLAVWRAGDGPLVVDGLKINLPINPLDFVRRKANVRAANIVACEVSWPPVPPTEVWESASVDLQRWLTPADDRELLACQTEMLHPPAEVTYAFGTMRRDPGYNYLRGAAEWGGGTIELSINAEFGGNAERQARALAAILADQPRWHADMLAIIDQQYDSWRDNWAQADELNLSRAQFVAHFRLETIAMMSPTMLSFWVSDGGLFGHHHIELQGDPEEGLKTFGLQG